MSVFRRGSNVALAILIAGAAEASAAAPRPQIAKSTTRQAAKQTRPVSGQPPGRAAGAQKEAPAPLPCGDPLGFQVLLDRQGFSSGQIDGNPGANTTHALTAFQMSRSIDVSGEPDCATWAALGGDETPATTTYTIVPQDADGLLTERIPPTLPEQAALPKLGYQSLTEKLGERFHAAPALLIALNKGTPINPGATITVPNVIPFDLQTKPVQDTSIGPVTVEVTTEGFARVIAADGRTVFFAPVSSGSEHDPLPLGDHKINLVAWMPPFHYNPDLFWDAKSTDSRATLKPGPNNPVGVVWIDIDVDHYGLHGTPEPSRVGHGQSHGCVRFTNWDAARLASLVGRGTPVVFK